MTQCSTLLITVLCSCTGRSRKSAANTGVRRSLALGNNVIITESRYTVEHGA